MDQLAGVLDSPLIERFPAGESCFMLLAGIGRFGGIMRIDGNYITAALLLLVTVPMYGYILAHPHDAREQPNPAHAEVPARIDVASLRRPVDLPGFKTHYVYGEALPAGYKCSGAGGSVYRVSTHNEVTEFEVLKLGGVVVSCNGDVRSSIR
jgi:hypothetical protein